MELQFIKADKEDALTMVDVESRAFYSDFVKYGECPGYGKTVEVMQAAMEINILYKVIANGMVVGVISIRPRETECYLGCLCIVPEFANRGIGKKAIAFLEREYPLITRWWLITPKDKAENHYFYKKCGFQIVGEKMDGSVPVVIFEKKKDKKDV